MIEPAQRIGLDVGVLNAEDAAHLIRPLEFAAAEILVPIPHAGKALRIDEACVRLGEFGDILPLDTAVGTIHAHGSKKECEREQHDFENGGDHAHPRFGCGCLSGAVEEGVERSNVVIERTEEQLARTLPALRKLSGRIVHERTCHRRAPLRVNAADVAQVRLSAGQADPVEEGLQRAQLPGEVVPGGFERLQIFAVVGRCVAAQTRFFLE